MQPQTGRRLLPLEKHGIKQVITLNGVEYGKGTVMKMRWKCSYKLGAEQRQEHGEIPALGVA
jgi:ADP-ribosylation factor-binding protein GGA